MKIVVCVKRVPDTATKIKVGADGKSIDRTDIEYISSPYDELANEYAVRLKEKSGDAEIVVVSLGPANSDKVLRQCLAMGADRAILVEDANEEGHDPYVVASALAEAIKEENPDLLLFGIAAVDDDYGQVGSMVADILGMPLLWGVSEPLEIADGKAKGVSEIDGGVETIEATLPCAASVKGSIKEVRMCSLISIRKARKKELKTVPANLGEATIEVEKLELPAERVGGKIVGNGVDAVPELFRLLREESKVL